MNSESPIKPWLKTLNTNLVAIDPTDVLAKVNSCALVEGRDLSDRLCEQLGQRHPHLLLHQCQPLVDLGVLCDGDRCLVENLFTLAGGDSQHYSVVLIEQNAGNASKHLFEVLLQFGHVLAIANDFQEVFISHKVEPENKKSVGSIKER